MTTQLNFGRDVQGMNAYAPQFCTDIYNATLAANTEKTVTVPSNYPTWVMYVRVQPTQYAWIALNHTAAVPSGSSLAAANSVLVDGTLEFKRLVSAADVVHVITSATTCDISIEFYAVGYP